MKKFKIIDLWVSIIFITGFAIVTIINRDSTFMLGYFVVGAWQVISMLVHVYYHSFTEKKSSRRTYHWITFISLITMPIGSFWILLYTAPFMAVFYTGLCFYEVRKMHQRPLAILK
jgi:heme/copper-type cytochrome/quinol oxidase subunit 4